MRFDLVIICAASYDRTSLSYLSNKYFKKQEFQWYFLLRSARWLQLFKQTECTNLSMWKNAVYMFRRANYYFRQECSK